MKSQKHGTFRIKLNCTIIHILKSYQILNVILKTCNHSGPFGQHATQSTLKQKQNGNSQKFLILATHTYQ